MLPRDLNFTMPAEWTKHERTFMAWPTNGQANWQWPDGLEETCKVFANLVNTISLYEPVTLLVEPTALKNAAKLCSSEVELLPLEYNDIWLRDSGPTFIKNAKDELAAVNWKFNAWGEKYYPWDRDNLVAPKILSHFSVPCFDAPIVLEGGSIHVDGEGTLLTTSECLLHEKRNPKLSKEKIEKVLTQYVNVEKIIWLNRGLDGDETDGHIDNVACFARPQMVIMQTCSDPSDPNCTYTKENLQILKDATDAKGRKFEIIALEQPPARYYDDTRLTLSYMNFYFVNNAIILPVFGGDARKTDDAAISTLKDIFPERKIVPIDGMSIIKGGGNVHCCTQQMPAGIPAKL